MVKEQPRIELKWIDRNGKGFYTARFKSFKFKITNVAHPKIGFYVIAEHLRKDIRLNTLWVSLTFKTFEEAEDFCTTFNYKNYRCIGKDV